MNKRESKAAANLLGQLSDWAMKNPKLAGCVGVVVVLGGLFFGSLYMLYRWVKTPDNANKSTTTNKRNDGGSGGGTSSRTTPRNLDEAKKLYLQMGNPSQATPDTSNANNYLMVKPEYVISYNRQRGTPNWVSWHVDQNDLGNLERADDFRPDDTLPTGWPRVTPTDYARSGYDRGHVCPSADRTANAQANSATFLMTNMIPQTGDNNRGPWRVIEEYTRSLVNKGNHVYVIAGAYGQKEQLRGGKITVPTNVWKVIVVMPPNATNAAQVNNNTRVIAVNLPNVEGIKSDDWRKYRTSVRAIEQATGYNLLSDVPANVQNTLETRVDNQ